MTNTSLYSIGFPPFTCVATQIFGSTEPPVRAILRSIYNTESLIKTLLAMRPSSRNSPQGNDTTGAANYNRATARAEPEENDGKRGPR